MTQSQLAGRRADKPCGVLRGDQFGGGSAGFRCGPPELRKFASLPVYIFLVQKSALCSMSFSAMGPVANQTQLAFDCRLGWIIFKAHVF